MPHRRGEPRVVSAARWLGSRCCSSEGGGRESATPSVVVVVVAVVVVLHLKYVYGTA